MLHLFMLMFLLGDVDSTCPSDTLTLAPSEILEEYGREVPVNCTSTYDLHDGMYWKHGVRHSNMSEDDDSFVSWTLSLSDWNVTKAECMIKMNDTFECSKDLPITLYKNPDMVHLYPLKYVKSVVEGTQCELQCDIIDVAPVQNVTVTWYKNTRVVRTESFTSNTARTPVCESSFLAFNVSRGDDGAVVRCEARLDFGPHGSKPPVLSGTHVIFVHYAPELNGTADEEVHVAKGADVTLTCDARGNPSPHFHWTRDGVNLTENTNYLNVTQVNSNVTYVCTATNRVGATTKHMHVYVRGTEDVVKVPAVALTTPKPQDVCSLTLTPDEVVVRFGDPFSINCTSSTEIDWFIPFGNTTFQRQAATWTVEEVEFYEWNIKPECQTLLINGHRCSRTPHITVYKTPDTVSVSSALHGPMVEDTDHPLICYVINVAPVQNLTVTWYRENKTVGTHTFQGPTVTPVNVSSILIVSLKSDDDGAQYRCSAELNLGLEAEQSVPVTYSEPYTAVVHYKPMMRHCPARFSGLEGSFSLDMMLCEAKGNPPPTIQWYYQGELVNTSEPLTRNHSGKYTAKVVNSISRSDTVVDITVEYGPSFTCESHYEVQESGNVQTMCDPEGVPTPTVSWVKDGNEMVPPQQWTKHHRGSYVLKAKNEHGTANHTLYLDVLFAPEIKEGNVSQEVTPGENVTLECHAEGNPIPELLWKFTSAVNVRQTTGGRHRSITVTGATSTNAGVYICVATNKVGTVSRSVTLRMKGQISGGRLSLILWPLLILSLIVFLILLFMVCRCRKKHGQYSFIPDQAKEGSDIPLTTKSDGTNI